MALSNSFDFTQNRDQLISDAFVEAGVLRPDETPESDENVYASNTLNRMLKAWQADGLHVFIHRDATLFLELDKTNYLIGPTGDNCTESFVETAIRVAASSGDTIMELDSTTGISASDNIGIEMDDGTMHWTTVSSVTDSDTLVVASGVDDDAAVDNVVYAYTNKAERPLRCVHAYYRTGKSTAENPTDTRMYQIARNDYLNLSNKQTESRPTEYWFDAQLDNAEMNLFGEPTDTTDRVRMMLQFPFDDMDSATDNFSFPPEWLEAIHLNLAYRLARSYRPKDKKTQVLKFDSEQAKRHVIGFDEERADIDIQPDRLWLRD